MRFRNAYSIRRDDRQAKTVPAVQGTNQRISSLRALGLLRQKRNETACLTAAAVRRSSANRRAIRNRTWTGPAAGQDLQSKQKYTPHATGVPTELGSNSLVCRRRANVLTVAMMGWQSWPWKADCTRLTADVDLQNCSSASVTRSPV